jgi:hypothetical protein
MPRFAKVQEFVDLCLTANDHFEKYKNSALHNLIDLLKSDACTPMTIFQEVLKIPHGKLQKYGVAMTYLFQTHPMLNPSMLPRGPLRQDNAAKFPKAPIPPGYNPSNNQGKEIMVGTPPTRFLNQSCEQFLLNSHDVNGIILIHLCKFQGPMDNLFNGRKVVDHMNAVLRVAAMLDVPVCALHMTEDVPVCAELKDAYDAVPQRHPVFRNRGHMGSVAQAFRDFASTKDNCIVMGFDGTICVHANIFGCAEFVDNAPATPAPPLISLTNVITSRAVLVNDGVLYSKGSTARPYGVLDNT